MDEQEMVSVNLCLLSFQSQAGPTLGGALPSLMHAW